jgi:hypothetical protein
MKARLQNLAADAIVWLGVLMVANGLGLLGARVLETIQHGR